MFIHIFELSLCVSFFNLFHLFFLLLFFTRVLFSSAFLISLPLLLTSPIFDQMGRFAYLVDSAESIESFKAQYKIPPGVFIRYCKEGDWHTDRQEGEVVILMIAFIEGGMRIPIGIVTKDYLRAHRLAPTQCALNMFRILGSVDALNERMGLNPTHHEVNWVYNLHHLKEQGYYLKTRYPKVRLISCLPDSNKSMSKDFLIISG